ncbi:MAG TPA: hypothetical protein VFH52_01850, partial [Rhodanobacteraceae bacterium]|nr:hypothetical protein [Rhodanobacteraceae bacterium]
MSGAEEGRTQVPLSFDQEIPMNARFSLLRARMAPTMLAAAVALAFGLSAPVQAQYTYPGTASSSGHIVREHESPVRERAGYGGAPSRYGNPGMGRGALNYGTSQSAAGYRNTVTGQSSGPNTKVTGQQDSFSGPNGQVNMGNQKVTGPNGQVVGQQSPGGKYGGGYGQQKGAGIGYGSNGAGVITQTGSTPGMASANGMNMNNGGSSGASEQAGAPDSFGEWVHRKAADSDPNVVSTTSSDNGTLTWHGDQKWSGTDDAGLTWNNGKPWNGPDGNGGSYQNGHHVVGVQNQDS